MLNNKLAGLFLVPAILCSANIGFALSDTASQVLNAELKAFIDIQPETAGAVLNTEINSETGALTDALISKFKIQANADYPVLYLKAKTKAIDEYKDAFFEKDGSTYIILSNNTIEPAAAAVQDCKAPTPTAKTNANAIAYKIASVALDNEGTATYNSGKSWYDVAILAGETLATTTLDTTAATNTYSFDDTIGTYQATLTLTTSAL